MSRSQSLKGVGFEPKDVQGRKTHGEKVVEKKISILNVCNEKALKKKPNASDSSGRKGKSAEEAITGKKGDFNVGGRVFVKRELR